MFYSRGWAGISWHFAACQSTYEYPSLCVIAAGLEVIGMQLSKEAHEFYGS